MPAAPRDVTASASERNAASAAFGRDRRLLNAGQFAAVFSARRILRGALFVLHYCPNGMTNARLGLVVPKKQARGAVVRNAIKRQVREIFRHRRDLPGADLVFRLTAPVRTADQAARAAWRGEILTLLDHLAQRMKSGQ